MNRTLGYVIYCDFMVGNYLMRMQNINELIFIVEKVKEKITDDSDSTWTGYDTAKKLQAVLGIYIQQLKSGDLSCLIELHKHFLPTCTFQEHSISNGWADEYIRLAEKFDNNYAAIKYHT